MSFRPQLLLAVALSVTTLAACCKNQPPPARPGVAEPPKALGAGSAAPAERPTNQAGCDACGGNWSRHGLAEVESCVCKSKDAGKVCQDGAECDGQCLADEDGGFEVKEAGPPALGYWKGHCSEFDTTFGCHRTIPHGARKKPPQTAEDAADSICVD